ncbi:uncharacterized protein LOC128210920 [Mya arenaria]|uniref:uncharacterized protein LOC128210920 n=1 Tax=Mya arenaria TaxID=6604 RepID=UPI0022E65C49|nr:uncharacterized protein LOC128210920 [Mya arenaria]
MQRRKIPSDSRDDVNRLLEKFRKICGQKCEVEIDHSVHFHFQPEFPGEKIHPSVFGKLLQHEQQTTEKLSKTPEKVTKTFSDQSTQTNLGVFPSTTMAPFFNVSVPPPSANAISSPSTLQPSTVSQACRSSGMQMPLPIDELYGIGNQGIGQSANPFMSQLMSQGMSGPSSQPCGNLGFPMRPGRVSSPPPGFLVNSQPLPVIPEVPFNSDLLHSVPPVPICTPQTAYLPPNQFFTTMPEYNTQTHAGCPYSGSQTLSYSTDQLQIPSSVSGQESTPQCKATETTIGCRKTPGLVVNHSVSGAEFPEKAIERLKPILENEIEKREDTCDNVADIPLPVGPSLPNKKAGHQEEKKNVPSNEKIKVKDIPLPKEPCLTNCNKDTNENNELEKDMTEEVEDDCSELGRSGKVNHNAKPKCIRSVDHMTLDLKKINSKLLKSKFIEIEKAQMLVSETSGCVLEDFVRDGSLRKDEVESDVKNVEIKSQADVKDASQTTNCMDKSETESDPLLQVNDETKASVSVFERTKETVEDIRPLRRPMISSSVPDENKMVQNAEEDSVRGDITAGSASVEHKSVDNMYIKQEPADESIGKDVSQVENDNKAASLESKSNVDKSINTSVSKVDSFNNDLNPGLLKKAPTLREVVKQMHGPTASDMNLETLKSQTSWCKDYLKKTLTSVENESWDLEIDLDKENDVKKGIDSQPRTMTKHDDSQGQDLKKVVKAEKDDAQTEAEGILAVKKNFGNVQNVVRKSVPTRVDHSQSALNTLSCITSTESWDAVLDDEENLVKKKDLSKTNSIVNDFTTKSVSQDAMKVETRPYGTQQREADSSDKIKNIEVIVTTKKPSQPEPGRGVYSCLKSVLDCNQEKVGTGSSLRLGPLQAHWNKISMSHSKKCKVRGKYLLQCSADLHFPIGVSSNSAGEVIIADTGNHCIKSFSPSGELLNVFGKEVFPAMMRPSAIVVNDQDDIFVKDDICIRVFDKDGTFQRNIAEKTFKKPFGLVLAPNGRLVVLETVLSSPCLVHVSQDGKNTWRFQFSPLIHPVVDLRSSKCRFLGISENHVIVSDLGASVLYMTTLEGVLTRTLGGYGTGPTQLFEPSGISVDNYGNFLVGDSKNNRIQMYRHDGTHMGVLELDKFVRRPSGIHLTSDHRLLVVNFLNHSIMVFQLESS